ncbi:MAG TPA: site-specific integrase [Polyangia bacterium]
MDDETLLRALREVREEITALRAGSRTSGADLIFADEWKRYADSFAREPWAANVRSLMTHVVAHFGTLPMSGVTIEEWERYVDARMAVTTRLGKPPARGSVNTELKRLKTFLRWLEERKRIAPSELHRAKPLRDRPGRQTEIHDDGLERALAIASPLMRAIILIAVDTGMRAAEVRTLAWRQINLATGRVTGYWSKSKTRKARTPRLTERAIKALCDMPRALGSDYVFANPDTKKPYGKSWVWSRWRDICVEARLEPDDPADERVHLHDARHTFVTQSLRRGVPLPVVMRLAGHSSAATTQRYTHIVEDDLDDAKRVIDAAIRRGPKRVVDGEVNPQTPEHRSKNT